MAKVTSCITKVYMRKGFFMPINVFFNLTAICAELDSAQVLMLFANQELATQANHCVPLNHILHHGHKGLIRLIY